MGRLAGQPATPGRESGDVEALVPEEILDAASVIALELDLSVLDGTAAGELRFEIRGQAI